MSAWAPDINSWLTDWASGLLSAGGQVITDSTRPLLFYKKEEKVNLIKKPFCHKNNLMKRNFEKRLIAYLNAKAFFKYIQPLKTYKQEIGYMSPFPFPPPKLTVHRQSLNYSCILITIARISSISNHMIFTKSSDGSNKKQLYVSPPTPPKKRINKFRETDRSEYYWLFYHRHVL